MYGDVDAAAKFFKTLTQHATGKSGIKMHQSIADSVMVDDCITSWMPDNINWFMNGLKQCFKITQDDELMKHLGDPVTPNLHLNKNDGKIETLDEL